MPNNPAQDQPHKQAGLPGAGQFDFKTHAPSTLTLDSPASGPDPRLHNPDRHALLLSQADRRMAAMTKLLDEQDKLSMESVSSGIRRDFPSATELRVKQNYTDRGRRLNSTLRSVRDEDGKDLTQGQSGWDFKRPADGGRSILNSFADIRPQFFDYQSHLGYDPETAEIIVPLDRDYAEGVELL